MIKTPAHRPATYGSLVVWVLAAGFLCVSTRPLAADPLKGVANQLTKGLDGLKDHQVAVLPFQYPDGGLSSGSSLVSESLITYLTGRKGVRIVERSQLARLLEEMRMESSGVTSTEKAQRWGQILAVDAVVTGTLVDEGDAKTEVRARLVRVDNGLVLAAANATIRRTWTDQPISPSREPLVVPPSVQALPAANNDSASAPDSADPDRVIRNPVQPNSYEIARQVYESNTDPRVRAGALYAMGIILEKQGLPAEAAQSYRRLLYEFPENSRLTTDALGRLWATGQNH